MFAGRAPAPRSAHDSSLDFVPGTVARRRIAVMQPYFFPYAGYFRLLAFADEFVIYDCVQFPRRGRVHRSEVCGANGKAEWLTLPLRPQARDVRIGDLAFADDARQRFDQRLSRLPWLDAGRAPAADAVRDHLRGPMTSVIDYLEAGLRLVADTLGAPAKISRSSTLAVDPALRGQDRVVAIVRALGGSHYLNAPGGRKLYQPQAFEQAGIALEFLPDYRGKYRQLLPALVSESAADIRRSLDIES